MPRPFTPAQRDENLRFLAILGETGNARLAAREIGRRASTMHHRRKVSAAFAQEWDAALAAAHARFHLSGGRRPPEARPEPSRRRGRRGPEGTNGTVTRDCPRSAKKGKGGLGSARQGLSTALETNGIGRRAGSGDPGRVPSPLRTLGGEAIVVRSQNGKLQLRFAHRDKLTKTAEQVFLASLSATANVRLSAAAAGASPAAFYRRRRRDAAFAREFRLALEMGYERLELAMLQAGSAESGAHDAWRRNDPPPIPPLTADQALAQLCHHRKSVELGWDMPHRRRRRGESDAIYTERLRAMWMVEKEREAEDAALRRAARWEETGGWRFEEEAAALPVPPLHLVTGWSKASGRAPHHPGVPLFGGWRIGDMERKLGRGR